MISLPILIRPPRGRGIPVYTNTTQTNKLNEDTIIKFEMLEDSTNYDVVRGIGSKWIVSNVEGAGDKRPYVVFMIDRESRGKKQLVTIACRDKATDIIKSKRIYDSLSGSFTAENYFKMVFENTGLDFKLTHDVSASKFENAGEGSTVEEMLKKGLEHFGLEYDIEFDNKTQKYNFVLTPQVEKKANYYISDEVNANSVKLEEDTGEYANYVVGYGDYTDEEGYKQAGLIMKYEHPDIEKYGKYEAEPLMNGKITDQDLMKRELQARLLKTTKTSLTLDFIVLREHFKEAIPKVADIVPVKHSIIGINDKVRIVEVETKRDENNRIYKQDVVLGEFNRRDRYMRRVSDAAKVVGGLGGGSNFSSAFKTTKTQVDAIRSSAQNAISSTQALNASGRGLRGVDGDEIVAFEKNGIKISDDGGDNFTTIITGKGLNKSAIPLATESSSGLMSSTDKKKLANLADGTSSDTTKPITDTERTKLGNLDVNANGLVLTDANGKKYNLVVVNGQISLKEVN